LGGSETCNLQLTVDDGVPMAGELSDIKIEKVFKKAIASQDTYPSLYHFALAYLLSDSRVRELLKPSAIKMIIHYKMV